jgi:hypothetical protein
MNTPATKKTSVFTAESVARMFLLVLSIIMQIAVKKLRKNEGVLDQLAEKTFAIQHNPNCPSPYLVRLAGKGRRMIALKPRSQTADILGYGKTLCEAAAAALEIQEKQRDESPAFTDTCE